MITNFQQYFKLVEYFSEFTKERMGLAMGVNNLIQIFDEKYYRNLSGGILEAFGKLFYRDLKVYMYPYHDKKQVKYINSENLKVHPRMKELYKFFKNNGKLINIDDFDPEILDVFSRTVLKMIVKGEEGWEEMLPKGIAEPLKKKGFLGILRQNLEDKPNLLNLLYTIRLIKNEVVDRRSYFSTTIKKRKEQRTGFS